ncbi:glycoside hydrolase family 15 protein [Candidatus Peregrinibacteria bacterium]|nr:glycoside hydrolase family 15 protein [Candidatus Peregrinibacteria bacterium]
MTTKSKYLKINDYGIIGDLVTVALIGKNGSIDWYCMPHINSPSAFAGLLDKDKGGHFSIRPSKKYSSKQQYIQHTNILETRFKTMSGNLCLTDFMPVKHVGRLYENQFPTLIRKVTCTKGNMEIDVDFMPRFDYARAKTVLKETEKGILAENHHEKLYLYCAKKPDIKDNRAHSKIQMKQGQTIWFVLQYNDDRYLDEERCHNAFRTTEAFWKGWVNDCDVCQIETGLFRSHWKNIIIRSGLVLKLLIQDMTGAICAAATTSLPETIGGERNWDYRFNWIRDASFTVRALYKLGYVNEARKNLEWFMHICTENVNPEKIQIMYGLNGEEELKEETLDHLSGYMDSSPVRIGNGAAKQKQWDIYGELVNVFYETRRFGIDISDKEWKFLCRIVDHVSKIWNQKDAGIWEVRGKYQHFVHSKLMCWVAVDRALKMSKKLGKKCPRKKWEKVRDEIKSSILTKGYNKKIGSFTQAYNSDIIDATSLMIPLMKLLPFDDYRIQNTINTVLKKLCTKDGLVYRYEHQTDDGLRGKEGAFLLCSFWLIDVLAYSGRVDEAKSILLRVLDFASPTGLLAEEVDPKTGESLGNYPQAYSHIGLINSALYIEKAKQHKIDISDMDLRIIAKKFHNIFKESAAARKAKKY